MTNLDKASANRFRFRAWDKSNLEMFEVRELKFHSSVSNPFTVFGTYGDGSDAEDVVLMQSTGLTDKNGKEIFEGDVLRRFIRADNLDEHGDSVDPGGFVGMKVMGGMTIRKTQHLEEMLGFVEYRLAEFMVRQPTGGGYGSICPERDEVIGNIYENPELLPAS